VVKRTSAEDEATVFERALEVAERQLAGKRRELERVSGEIGHLRQVVNGLRGALGMEPEEAEAAPTQWIRPTSVPVTGWYGGGTVTTGDPTSVIVSQARATPAQPQPGQNSEHLGQLATAASLPRRSPGTSSTSRAAAVINELGRPLTLLEVLHEFQNRGWIEESWRAPEAAVAQAVRRAVRSGLIARVDRRHYGPRTVVVANPATEPTAVKDGGTAESGEEVSAGASDEK
jgi:hypothetical protein